MQSNSNKKAVAKYHAKLDEIKIRVPKGEREKYKAYAESKGMSLNALFIKLIRQDMGEALTEPQTEDTANPDNSED